MATRKDGHSRVPGAGLEDLKISGDKAFQFILLESTPSDQLSTALENVAAAAHNEAEIGYHTGGTLAFLVEADTGIPSDELAHRIRIVQEFDQNNRSILRLNHPLSDIDNQFFVRFVEMVIRLLPQSLEPTWTSNTPFTDLTKSTEEMWRRVTGTQECHPYDAGGYCARLIAGNIRQAKIPGGNMDHLIDLLAQKIDSDHDGCTEYDMYVRGVTWGIVHGILAAIQYSNQGTTNS